MYDEVTRLIEKFEVAFPKFGSGVSEMAIRDAESALGLPLPNSYKWWLANYGGGQVRGDIVYGLDEEGIGKPDIVALARMNESDGLYDRSRLLFSVGNEENFYFDTTEMHAGEYRIFTHDVAQNSSLPYAPSFADFLLRRIRELYGVH